MKLATATSTTSDQNCVSEGGSCQGGGTTCCPGLVCNDEGPPDRCRVPEIEFKFDEKDTITVEGELLNKEKEEEEEEVDPCIAPVVLYLKPLNGCTKLLVDFEDKNNGCHSSFDLVSGTYADGTFEIQKTPGGECDGNAKLDTNTWFRCIETTMEASSTTIHTSCSEPIPLCGVYGDYQVVGYENEEGSVGLDDSCPGPARRSLRLE